MKAEINFENTEFAYAAKSDTDLKRAHFIFSLIQYQWLVDLTTALVPLLLKWNLPIQGLIRKTIFQQFVGGETLDQTIEVTEYIHKYNVQSVLDFGAEGGPATEKEKDANAGEFISAVQHTASRPSVAFVSIKISAIASVDLMTKVNILMQPISGTLVEKYQYAVQQLDDKDGAAWRLVEQRLHRIIGIASVHKVKVLVDAEESWVQDCIDGLITLLLPFYNSGRVILYYSVQLYRHDRLAFLKDLHSYAVSNELTLGVKLVRGAYMEKERNRAAEKQYPSPIHKSKEAVDRDFDAAVAYCIDHIGQIAVVVATHNEQSCRYAVQLMEQRKIDHTSMYVHFSQLFGMGDHLTFNLAKEGYAVSKYIPYGPVVKVIPYLLRRAEENSSVHGQGNKEYALICREMERRGL